MPPVGFEPTISADERPQTYGLGRAATGTGASCHMFVRFWRVEPRHTKLDCRVFMVS